jgi:putative DNA primase/helicase
MRIDFNEVRSSATGKWLSIWRSLGIDVDETGRHGPCPVCVGKDRFRVDRDVDEKGSYFCSGCGPGFGFDLVMKVCKIEIVEAMEAVSKIVGTCEKRPIPKEKTMTPEIMRKIFTTSAPIQNGDVAHKYLENRGLSVFPPTLRHSRKCWNPETKKDENALLAVFTLPDNKAVTMQRIFLTMDGDKLPVNSPKRHLPVIDGRKMNGGACRIFPFLSGTIGVAEGIETAIAAHQDTKIPVWATLSSALMESFEPPPKVESMIIFSDNDSHKEFSGQKAAYTLASRMAKKGIKVTVYVPDQPGHDWLDVLNGQKK